MLWPRLERAKLRKLGDDPQRIAELVTRRTSQPYDAVLAMITRQSTALTDQTVDEPLYNIRSANGRVALRIVRDCDGDEIRIQHILPIR